MLPVRLWAPTPKPDDRLSLSNTTSLRYLYGQGQAAAEAAGGDYWVKRIVDNMYTESWARYLWPVIGMVREESNTGNLAAEVGRRVAALMSDPATRQAIINKEQVAEAEERAENRADDLKAVATVAGIAALATTAAKAVNAGNAKSLASSAQKVTTGPMALAELEAPAGAQAPGASLSPLLIVAAVVVLALGVYYVVG